jgi:hypothetical protein
MMSEPGSAPRRLARFAPDVVFAALVLIGVFRPQLPAALKSHWIAAVVVLGLAAAVFCVVRLRAFPSKDPYPQLLGTVFSLALVALYLQPQRVASDGVHYFATLRSIVVDGDLDFENEYRILRADESYFQRTATGRLPNNHSVGPALLWSPVYLLLHGLGHMGLFRPTGFGYPYFTAIATVTALAGFLGVLWLYRLASRYFESPVAFASSLLIWLGTFHLWYMVFEPSMSHAFGMASVTGFLLLGHRVPKNRWDFALVGLAAGMVALIRWQNAVFLPVGLAVIWTRNGRPKWEEIATFATTATAVFLPQMIFWKLIYGQFLLIPQGGSFLRWGSPEVGALLFSSRHGLLSWSPLLWVGAVGLFGLVKKTPLLATSLLAALMATVYINAAVHDWWAGASFGARRFDGALAAFGLGLAMSIEWLVPRVRKHALLAVSLILAPFLVWNTALMAVYSRGAIPMDGAISFRQAGGDALELIYRWTGYPFSWPAALVERYRKGVPRLVPARARKRPHRPIGGTGGSLCLRGASGTSALPVGDRGEVGGADLDHFRRSSPRKRRSRSRGRYWRGFGPPGSGRLGPQRAHFRPHTGGNGVRLSTVAGPSGRAVIFGSPVGCTTRSLCDIFVMRPLELP